jgi:hypothetical protein
MQHTINRAKRFRSILTFSHPLNIPVRFFPPYLKPVIHRNRSREWRKGGQDKEKGTQTMKE